jgi:hypothetical protein
MKHTELKQNEIGDDSLIGLSADLKKLSNEEDNSHEGKLTRFSGNIKDFNSLLKKENASGTGYLCDDDEGRDEQFQND